jgi:hypothetical protein
MRGVHWGKDPVTGEGSRRRTNKDRVGQETRNDTGSGFGAGQFLEIFVKSFDGLGFLSRAPFFDKHVEQQSAKNQQSQQNPDDEKYADQGIFLKGRLQIPNALFYIHQSHSVTTA